MEISLVIMGEAHQLSSDLGTGLMASRCASSDQLGVLLGVMNAAGYMPLGNNSRWLYVLCVFTSLLVTSDYHKDSCVLGLVVCL